MTDDEIMETLDSMRTTLAYSEGNAEAVDAVALRLEGSIEMQMVREECSMWEKRAREAEKTACKLQRLLFEANQKLDAARDSMKPELSALAQQLEDSLKPRRTL